MTKEEIEYKIEERKENELGERSSKDARSYISQVARLFNKLDVDKEVQSKLSKAIQNGDVYKDFHLHNVKHKVASVITIYQFYKEL